MHSTANLIWRRLAVKVGVLVFADGPAAQAAS
jgi:hypothetical protein